MKEFQFEKMWWATADEWRAFPANDAYSIEDWVNSREAAGHIVVNLGEDLGFRVGLLNEKPQHGRVHSMAAMLMSLVDTPTGFLAALPVNESEAYVLSVRDGMLRDGSERIVPMDSLPDYFSQAVDDGLPIYASTSLETNGLLPTGHDVGLVEGDTLIKEAKPGRNFRFKLKGGGHGKQVFMLLLASAALGYMLLDTFKPEWLEFGKKVDSPVPIIKSQAQKDREMAALMQEKVEQVLRRLTATKKPDEVFRACNESKLASPFSIGGWEWLVKECNEQSFRATYPRKKGTAPADEIAPLLENYRQLFSPSMVPERVTLSAGVAAQRREGISRDLLPPINEALADFIHFAQVRADIGHRVTFKDMGMKPLKINYEGTEYDVRPQYNFGTARLSFNRTSPNDLYGLAELLDRPHVKLNRIVWNKDPNGSTVSGDVDIFYRRN